MTLQTTEKLAGNTLFPKLSAVMAECHRVPKNGYNKFNQYHYATEADALDVIRPLLAKHGIGVMFGVDEVTELNNARVLVKVRIVLGDESSQLETHVYGEARDADRNGNPQDKGLYKAITGAMKYWVLKTFLLSTGDDPEGDQNNEPAAQSKAAPKQQSQPAAKPRVATGHAPPIGNERAVRLAEHLMNYDAGLDIPPESELAQYTEDQAKAIVVTFRQAAKEREGAPV